MYRLCFIAMTLVSLSVSSASAQSNVLAEYYGRGVHAYFNHDLINAYDYFTKAIDNGINDPRAYYFRGLTSVASGREYEAESDYRAGADLEAKGAFGPAISQALTRIQGSHRMAIEDMRLQARLDYAAAAKARSDARYGDIQAAESDVLRDRPAPRPPVAPPAVPVAPAAENPFANDAATGQPKVESKDALEGTMTDPFADDAAPASPAGDAPAAAPGDDPFGGSDAAPADDPFGGSPATGDAPASGDDPFGGSDPFGN
jgi:hypothetical protein